MLNNTAESPKPVLCANLHSSLLIKCMMQNKSESKLFDGIDEEKFLKETRFNVFIFYLSCPKLWEFMLLKMHFNEYQVITRGGNKIKACHATSCRNIHM